MTHLTLEKFRSALHKGLGRAVIQVRQQGHDNIGVLFLKRISVFNPGYSELTPTH